MTTLSKLQQSHYQHLSILLCKYKTKKKEYNNITVTNTLKGKINSTALKLISQLGLNLSCKSLKKPVTNLKLIFYLIPNQRAYLLFSTRVGPKQEKNYDFDKHSSLIFYKAK